MKLISSTDFTIREFDRSGDLEVIGHNILKWSKFLKRPLELGMFIPCSDNEPFNYSKHGNEEEYKQAKEKILFKGFNLTYSSESSYIVSNGKWVVKFYIEDEQIFTIETLVYKDLELTESAIKQLGLL